MGFDVGGFIRGAQQNFNNAVQGVQQNVNNAVQGAQQNFNRAKDAAGGWIQDRQRDLGNAANGVSGWTQDRINDAGHQFNRATNATVNNPVVAPLIRGAGGRNGSYNDQTRTWSAPSPTYGLSPRDKVSLPDASGSSVTVTGNRSGGVTVTNRYGKTYDLPAGADPKNYRFDGKPTAQETMREYGPVKLNDGTVARMGKSGNGNVVVVMPDGQVKQFAPGTSKAAIQGSTLLGQKPIARPSYAQTLTGKINTATAQGDRAQLNSLVYEARQNGVPIPKAAEQALAQTKPQSSSYMQTLNRNMGQAIADGDRAKLNNTVYEAKKNGVMIPSAVTSLLNSKQPLTPQPKQEIKAAPPTNWFQRNIQRPLAEFGEGFTNGRPGAAGGMTVDPSRATDYQIKSAQTMSEAQHQGVKLREAVNLVVPGGSAITEQMSANDLAANPYKQDIYGRSSTDAQISASLNTALLLLPGPKGGAGKAVAGAATRPGVLVHTPSAPVGGGAVLRVPTGAKTATVRIPTTAAHAPSVPVRPTAPIVHTPSAQPLVPGARTVPSAPVRVSTPVQQPVARPVVPAAPRTNPTGTATPSSLGGQTINMKPAAPGSNHYVPDFGSAKPANPAAPSRTIVTPPKANANPVTQKALPAAGQTSGKTTVAMESELQGKIPTLSNNQVKKFGVAKTAPENTPLFQGTAKDPQVMHDMQTFMNQGGKIEVQATAPGAKPSITITPKSGNTPAKMTVSPEYLDAGASGHFTGAQGQKAAATDVRNALHNAYPELAQRGPSARTGIGPHSMSTSPDPSGSVSTNGSIKGAHTTPAFNQAIKQSTATGTPPPVDITPPGTPNGVQVYAMGRKPQVPGQSVYSTGSVKTVIDPAKVPNYQELAAQAQAKGSQRLGQQMRRGEPLPTQITETVKAPNGESYQFTLYPEKVGGNIHFRDTHPSLPPHLQRQADQAIPALNNPSTPQRTIITAPPQGTVRPPSTNAAPISPRQTPAGTIRQPAVPGSGQPATQQPIFKSQGQPAHPPGFPASPYEAAPLKGASNRGAPATTNPAGKPAKGIPIDPLTAVNVGLQIGGAGVVALHSITPNVRTNPLPQNANTTQEIGQFLQDPKGYSSKNYNNVGGIALPNTIDGSILYDSKSGNLQTGVPPDLYDRAVREATKNGWDKPGMSAFYMQNGKLILSAETADGKRVPVTLVPPTSSLPLGENFKFKVDNTLNFGNIDLKKPSTIVGDHGSASASISIGQPYGPNFTSTALADFSVQKNPIRLEAIGLRERASGTPAGMVRVFQQTDHATVGQIAEVARGSKDYISAIDPNAATKQSLQLGFLGQAFRRDTYFSAGGARVPDTSTGGSKTAQIGGFKLQGGAEAFNLFKTNNWHPDGTNDSVIFANQPAAAYVGPQIGNDGKTKFGVATDPNLDAVIIRHQLPGSNVPSVPAKFRIDLGDGSRPALKPVVPEKLGPPLPSNFNVPKQVPAAPAVRKTSALPSSPLSTPLTSALPTTTAKPQAAAPVVAVKPVAVSTPASTAAVAKPVAASPTLPMAKPVVAPAALPSAAIAANPVNAPATPTAIASKPVFGPALPATVATAKPVTAAPAVTTPVVPPAASFKPVTGPAVLPATAVAAKPVVTPPVSAQVLPPPVVAPAVSVAAKPVTAAPALPAVSSAPALKIDSSVNLKPISSTTLATSGLNLSKLDSGKLATLSSSQLNTLSSLNTSSIRVI